MVKYGSIGERDLKENKNFIKERETLLKQGVLKGNEIVFSANNIYQWDGYNSGNIIYVDRGKKNIVLVVGESWTYGDSLQPYVKVNEQKDNISYRLSKIFASKIALEYDSDLLLCATPGQSNSDILNDLEQSLIWINEKKPASDIKVITQITSPGRCIRNYDEWHKYNLTTLFETKKKWKLSVPFSFDKWHIEYEDAIFYNLSQILKRHNVESLVWKNFNEFLRVSDHTYQNINIIKVPAQRYMCELSLINTVLPLNLESDFYERADTLVNLVVTKTRLEKEIKKINKSYDDLNFSQLNNWHFNETGHWVWYLKIKERLDKKSKIKTKSMI